MVELAELAELPTVHHLVFAAPLTTAFTTVFLYRVYHSHYSNNAVILC